MFSECVCACACILEIQSIFSVCMLNEKSYILHSWKYIILCFSVCCVFTDIPTAITVPCTCRVFAICCCDWLCLRYWVGISSHIDVMVRRIHVNLCEAATNIGAPKVCDLLGSSLRAKCKKPHFVERMILKVLYALCFSLKQPLDSPDDWYIVILKTMNM